MIPSGGRIALVALAVVTLAGVRVSSPPDRRWVSAELIDDLGCAACHPGTPGSPDRIRQRAPTLVGAAERYDGAFMFDYLRAPPVRVSAGRSRMPDFRMTDREALALTMLLSNGQMGLGGDAARRYRAARDAYPDVDADIGAVLFTAFRCAACHDDGSGRRPPRDAPDLGRTHRVRPEWLRTFLARPEPVRPFGAVPGTGSRMPDFRLADPEVDSIVRLLSAARPEQPWSPDVTALSPFQRDKAERLIRDRWPCLGCHRLDGVGGRIGPDLSGVGGRLTPWAIRAMIDDPHGSVPGTVMPKRIMPADRVDLAARYLAARVTVVPDPSLSPVDDAPREVRTGRDAAGLYDRYCANCHGVSGEGDGYNARFLPVPPTRHADSASMARRPDDTLFDGIHVGGFILDRSHRMPGFGQRFSYDEIRSLVRHIRTLCDCEGPSWSRDGSK